jgi:hypothetical protein
VPIPLADSIAAALSDRTTALAAAFVIGTRHADVLQWVAKSLLPDLELQPKPRSNSGGRVRRAPRRSNGHGGPRSDSRTTKRDADDEALLEAMRSNAEGPLAAWSEAIGKSRTSVVSALHRLKDAGLVANEDRLWTLVEEPAPRVSSARWVEPLKARDRAAHAHLNAAS